MDRIAIIYGETFLYWSSIILTLAVAAAVCVFLCLYLREKFNGLGAAFLVPACLVASIILSRLMHWYCMANAYESLKGALTTFTGGGYALMGVFAGCALAACLLRLIRVSKNLPEMLDCMVLAGAVGIGVGRLSSLFNSSDRGMNLKDITQLPLAYPVANAVTGEPEYRLATFMLQSMVTLGIFAVLLIFWLCM